MRALKLLAAIVIPPIVILGALYLFAGLRIELSGGGMPHLVFRADHDEQAELIARHRAAQRAAMPPPPAPLTTPPAPVAPGAGARSDAPAGPTTVAPATAPPVEMPTYWTDFRGPRRDAQYRERPLLATWPATGLAPLWRQPAGAGYASFSAAHGRAFTIEQRGHEEVVASYDVSTGRELWTHGWAALFRESMGGDGPRATPTWFDGRVYALGAMGELRCLDDATGRLVWRTNILDDSGAHNLIWGMAGAPLIVGDGIEEGRHDSLGGELTGTRATGDEVHVSVTSIDETSSQVAVGVEDGNRNMAEIIHGQIGKYLGTGSAKTGFYGGNKWEGTYDTTLARALMAGERAFEAMGFTVSNRDIKENTADLMARRPGSSAILLHMEAMGLTPAAPANGAKPPAASEKTGQVKVGIVVGTARSEDNEEILQRMKSEFERFLK